MLETNENKKFTKEGITFDDVLLIPGESDCTPDMVDIHTHLTKDIVLNTPIMTSAMDTVTESRMAIAIAREGGIGIIHKNMTIALTRSLLQPIKQLPRLTHLWASIRSPVCLSLIRTTSWWAYSPTVT